MEDQLQINSEAVNALRDEIGKVCHDKHSSHVLTALWFMLLEMLMLKHECSVDEVLHTRVDQEHAKDRCSILLRQRSFTL